MKTLFARRPTWLFGVVALLMVALPCAARAAEVIPPAPKQYFNDYANVISAGTERELNSRLEQFEKDTSSQIVVAIYPKMQSDSSIEDYTVRVAHSWKVGREKEDNGAVLFIFVQDRAMYLQVGYGLEGALPDALAKNIIDTEIIPHIRAGNWDAALRQGVDSILAATRGEYKGTGRTVNQGHSRQKDPGIAALFPIVLIILMIIVGGLKGRRGYGYGRRGYGPIWIGGLGGGFGGRGGGGFGGFGGGGGFSGGGGGFGGGGAGGRW